MEPALDIKPTTLVSLVGDRLKDYGRAPALTFQGKTMRYDTLSRKIDQAAQGFQEMGIEKGDNVGLFLPNTPFFPIAFHGALKAGGTVSAINSLFEPEQIKHQIQDSNIETLVTMDSSLMLPKVMEVMNDNDTPLKNVIVGKTAELLPFPKNQVFKAATPITKFHEGLSDGTRNLLDHVKLVRKIFKAMADLDKLTIEVPNDPRMTLFSDLTRNAGQPDEITITPEDLAVLQYTGGTTGGKPKAAMLTQNNIASNILQGLAAIPEFREGKERMLGALPLFHIFGNAMMNLGLYKGAEIYLHPKATDIDDVSKLIHKSKATFMAGTPALYAKLVPAAKKKGHDYSNLKMVVSGGDALPMSTSDAFAEIAAPIRSGYGLSECPVACVMSQAETYEPGLAGRIIPGTDIRIIDPETREAVEPGNTGEICLGGPQVTSGYMGQDDVNARVFTEDGYFKTGDLGRVSEDVNGNKSLHITGRIKNVIIRGGHNIYPEDIDGIENHTQVAETCTFGVPAGGGYGQFVATLIRLHDDASDNEQTIASVLDHIAENVGRFDRPNFIAFVDDIPKTKIMKLDRNEAIRRVQDGELSLQKVDFKTNSLKEESYILPAPEEPAAPAL